MNLNWEELTLLTVALDGYIANVLYNATWSRTSKEEAITNAEILKAKLETEARVTK